MLNSSLVEQAFRVGLDPGFTGKIDQGLIHEIGGTWEWTLNPHFDIRLLRGRRVSGGGRQRYRQYRQLYPGQPAALLEL